MHIVRNRFLSICIFCLLLITQANGQAIQLGDEGFRFPKNKQKVHIPFKLIHNLIIIPVQINNSKPLNFVVDTGVDRTLVVEIGPYDSISLADVKYIMLRGLGQGAGIEALLSTGNRLRFAGLEARGQEIMVLEENIFNISARVGMEVNGIIGYPLFKDFIVEINYANKVLSLYKPGTYPKNRVKKGVVLPITVEDNKPYMTVKATSEKGDTQQLKLVIDSGMSSSMLLYPGTLPEAFIPQKTINAYLGRGLNGDIHGEIGRLKNIEVGGYVLPKPTASFPDSLSVRYALSLNDRNGNLGADVLQRFRVVFDYANLQLMLVPNSQYKKPFYFNLSGMELINPMPGMNFYVISEVIPNSPAQKAGLLQGDNLVSINGENCFNKSLEEILNLFQNRPGRKLNIRVSRKSKVIDTTLRLQDII